MNQARERTSTKKTVIKLLYIGQCFLLVNIWIYIQWTCPFIPRRGDRHHNLDFQNHVKTNHQEDQGKTRVSIQSTPFHPLTPLSIPVILLKRRMKKGLRINPSMVWIRPGMQEYPTKNRNNSLHLKSKSILNQINKTLYEVLIMFWENYENDFIM